VRNPDQTGRAGSAGPGTAQVLVPELPAIGESRCRRIRSAGSPPVALGTGTVLTLSFLIDLAPDVMRSRRARNSVTRWPAVGVHDCWAVLVGAIPLVPARDKHSPLALLSG